jgi:23S rRNA (guanosine2251-2'-O)-methyltransferase
VTKPWENRGENRARRDGPPPKSQRSFHKSGPRPGPRPDFKSGSRQGRLHAGRGPDFLENGDVWLWGYHAVAAALANPRRHTRELLVTRNAAHRLGIDTDAPPAFLTLLEPRDIDQRLPTGAVHQGAAMKAAPLEPEDVADWVLKPEAPIVILDGVTDPQNVGAVFRSAEAFGFAAVVLQTRNAPALGGVLAKAAAGSIERVTEIRTVNISRAIAELKDAGWNVVGLAGEADNTLEQAFNAHGPLAVVLGAEGDGLRHGVGQACSSLARIEIASGVESLNVSNAAAVAFYEASKRVRKL